MTMQIYVIESLLGRDDELRPVTGLRVWQADDVEHALDQHKDAFPEEPYLGISVAIKASSAYDAARPTGER
jgi:hypothetical protein